MDSQTPLAGVSLQTLAARLHAPEPTPGGGAAAAATGVLGVALAGMVVRYSFDETSQEVRSVQEEVDRGLVQVGARLERLIDDDVDAYQAVVRTRTLPRTTEDDRAHAKQARQAALRRATEVPLRTARLCLDALEMLEGLLGTLRSGLRSDASSAALLLRAALRCALENVRINLGSKAAAGKGEMAERTRQVDARAASLEASILNWAAASSEAKDPAH